MVDLRGKWNSCWKAAGIISAFAFLLSAHSVLAYPSMKKGKAKAPQWVTVKPTKVKTFGKASPHGGAVKSKGNNLPKGHPPIAPRQRGKFVHPSMGANTRKAQPSRVAMPKGQPSMAEQQRILAMRMNQEQTQTYQRLIGNIVSPCCWTQPVSLHASKSSDMIKVDIQRRLLAGHTERQIISAYKKRFGERILSVPEKSYIFLIPIAASLFALFLVGFVILRWTQRPGETPSSLDVSLDDGQDTEATAEEAASPPSDSETEEKDESESKSDESQK